MDELQMLLDAFKNLVMIDDEALTDEVLDNMIKNIDAQFSPELMQQAIKQIVKNLGDQELSKADANTAIKSLSETIKEMIYGEEVYVGNKKILVDAVVDKMLGIFQAAADKYHSYAIELPMTIAEGARVPTYAHDTDAAADLYAMEDTLLQANSKGNKIRTGVNIQLPEGWLALIIPRSSIGAKTSLRLSNSVGLIDSGYRGELGVLYDNIGDKLYEIHAGDRIAQLLVMPSYRFKAKVVDTLENTDRGTGGFGSTGT